MEAGLEQERLQQEVNEDEVQQHPNREQQVNYIRSLKHSFHRVSPCTLNLKISLKQELNLTFYTTKDVLNGIATKWTGQEPKC